MEKGIKKLSVEWNIRLTVILLTVCFTIAGPTLFIVSVFFTGFWDYLVGFIPMGLWIEPDSGVNWQGGLDYLLLGLVWSLGTFCRYVYRQN